FRSLTVACRHSSSGDEALNDRSNTLELTPSLSAVAQALQWLEDLGTRHGWTPRLQFALTLGVDEALTNIISYAFPDAGPAASPPYIRLMHRADALGVHIDIHDNGVAFAPPELPPPPALSSIEEA